MEFLKIVFPVSGVKTYLFVPPLVAFVLAFLGVMGGITGAFLLLPFQLSLNYTSPGVSATNLLYNLFTIPPALWRYGREGRFHGPLTLVMSLGVAPGMFLGYLLRLSVFRDPGRFKLLVSLVLFYLAGRILKDLLRSSPSAKSITEIHLLRFDFYRMVFRFGEETYEVRVPTVLGISFAVGIVSGIYGIGGGAILAPFLISVFGLPIHAVAASTLATTFLASLLGLGFYSFGPGSGPETRPDLALGGLFGIGGLAGAYFGARFQKRVPERPIKWGLFAVIILTALKYIYEALG